MDATPRGATRTLVRGALLALALATLAPSAASAAPLLDCGAEGERPCGLFDATFWDNGTGFCDAGLIATDFNVLPDIPAFRGNAWVNVSETNVQPLRDIIGAAMNVQTRFEALDTSDWWHLETVAEVSVCLPVVGCLDAPLKRPAIADELVGAIASLGELVAQVQHVPALVIPILEGDSFTITPHLPFAPPTVHADVQALLDGAALPDGFCRDDVGEACELVPTAVCEQVPRDVCHQIPRTICQNVQRYACWPEKQCSKVCKNLPWPLDKACDTVCSTVTKCDWVTEVACHQVWETACETVWDTVCETIPQQVCQPVAERVCIPDVVAAGGWIGDYAQSAAALAQGVLDQLVGLVGDLDAPPGVCDNHRRHGWDADVHVHADGSLARHANGALVRGDGLGDAPQHQATWAYRAFMRQRELGADEPLNWIQHLDSHNAYNNVADGYIVPNQRYSLSDQLALGVRSIELDVNHYAGHLRLCHGKADGIGCSAFDRLFDNALKELRVWLDAHPDEVILLRIEDYAGDASGQQDYIDLLEARLGDLLYRHTDGSTVNSPSTPWPSINALRATNKRVVIVSYFHDHLSDALWANPVVEQSAGKFFRADNPRHICAADFTLLADPATRGLTYGDDRTWRTADGDSPSFEERDFAGLHEIIRVTESRPLLETALSAPGTPEPLLGEAEAAALASCRATLVSMDYIHAKEETPVDTCVASGEPLATCRAHDLRLDALVWSWTPGDDGQHGPVALLDGATGRWRSASPDLALPFTCARVRTGDPAAWADPAGRDWRVTAAVGPWSAGHAACRDELGDGWEFSAPRTGWQNARLVEANTAQADLWLNQHDLDGDGRWLLHPTPELDLDATVHAVEGVPVALTAHVTAAAAIDRVIWRFDDGATLAGPTVTRTFADDGVYLADVTVVDALGGIATRTVEILVDNAAPEVAAPRDLTRFAGERLAFTVHYADLGVHDAHTVTVEWGDGAVTTRAADHGQLLVAHAYAEGGAYDVVVRVEDDGGDASEAHVAIAIWDLRAAALALYELDPDFALAALDALAHRGEAAALEVLAQAAPALNVDGARPSPVLGVVLGASRQAVVNAAGDRFGRVDAATAGHLAAGDALVAAGDVAGALLTWAAALRDLA